MDDALQVCLERERAVAARLYRFAKAVRAAYLEEASQQVTVFDLPSPSDGDSLKNAEADAKIALQDPSLKALVDAIRADGQTTVPLPGAARRQDMWLLQWWALLGDFEIALQRRLGAGSSSQQQRRFFPKPRNVSTNARYFREGRVELTRGTGDPGPNALHPIAWYVQCVSAPVWTPYIDGRAVGEVLVLYGTGGWQKWHDVLFEFYDAVTHAASRRFVTSMGLRAFDGTHALPVADFAKSISESARVFGLPSQSPRAPAAEIVLSSSLDWPSEEVSLCLRPALQSDNRCIRPIVMTARPVAYVRSAGKRKDWGARTQELIRQADSSWPEHEAIGRWLAHEMRNPTRLVADALAAIGGVLTRSLGDPSDRTGAFTEEAFLLRLQGCLNRGGVAVIESETASRRLAIRSRLHGRWNLSIDGGSITIPLGQTQKVTCPLAMSDAIERFDQVAWSCAMLAAISNVPAWIEARDVLLSADGWAEKWECVKGQLLDLSQEPSDSQLIDSFHALRAICLRLDNALTRNGASVKPSSITSEIHRHARIRLRELVATILGLTGGQPHATRGGLYPPRITGGELAGDVDVGKWLDDPWWYGGESVRHPSHVSLRPSQQGVMHVEENVAAIGMAFIISIPFASSADEALSACPGALIWTRDPPPPRYLRMIHECLRTPVQHALRQQSTIDFSLGLESLSKRFAADDGANHFHEMIQLATNGDETASACLSALRSDSRFGLPCFPEVIESDGKWTIRAPRPSDAELAFRFSDTPRNETIQIRFAISRDKAKRLVSRGPQDASGLQALAGRIMEWCKDLPDSLQLHAKKVMKRSDRHEMFGEPLAKGIEEAAAILQLIARSGERNAAVKLAVAQRDDGFQKLKAWMNAAGVQVEPDTWSSDLGSDSVPSEATESPAEFNAVVPEGRVVVKEFGVLNRNTATRFGAFQGCRSAGPSPPHYDKLLSLGDSPGGERLTNWLRRVPAKKLQGHEPYRSDVYELYSIISQSRYRRELGSPPEWDLPSNVLDNARLLVEQWYEGEFECEAFPKEKEIVEVYSDIEKAEIRNLAPGEIEGGLVRVVVKGFKSKTGKILPARVYKEPVS
jgi:hypothetical protein